MGGKGRGVFSDFRLGRVSFLWVLSPSAFRAIVECDGLGGTDLTDNVS